MARDENLRRNDWSLAKLSTDWSKPGGMNKLTKHRDTMYVCPECGHHALAVATNMWFNCWACGVWGQFREFRSDNENLRYENENLRYDNENDNDNNNEKHPMTPQPKHHSPLPCAGAGGGSLLTDYVQLPSEVLDRIKDISLDPTVSGMQFEARRWLEAQNIPIEAAHRMRWGVAKAFVKAKGEDKGHERTCIVFRNYVDGYCCNAKFRSLDKKGFTQESSATPCAPYNIDCLRPSMVYGSGFMVNGSGFMVNGDSSAPTSINHTPSSVNTLYITEGEKDCLILRMLGFLKVVSVASGAQTDMAASFEAFRPWLQTISEVIVCGDQDRPGRQMAASAVAYFNDKRVRVAQWDQRVWGKDISEVWQHHGAEEALRMVNGAREAERHGIEDFTTESSIQAVMSAARNEFDPGYSIGAGQLTDKHLRLWDGGGLCIVTGRPGTGKTDWLNFMTMSLAHSRQCHVCYCSFENPDKQLHAGQLTQIWAGDTDLSLMQPDEVMPYVQTTVSHITHIDMRSERPTYKAILHRAETVMAMHPDTQYLIIDPYLYVQVTTGQGITETEAIKELLTRVQDWAWAHGIWVFIVAHPRKLNKADGSNELEEIDYYTISGSAHWANVADLVFALKRELRANCDYTVLSVLKVRKQRVCTPGDIFYVRQQCGRYDECASASDAMTGTVINQDVMPWETNCD